MNLVPLFRLRPRNGPKMADSCEISPNRISQRNPGNLSMALTQCKDKKTAAFRNGTVKLVMKRIFSFRHKDRNLLRFREIDMLMNQRKNHTN